VTAKNPCREYFSRNLLDGSRHSAEEIVPFLLSLIRPNSVLDVGCGTGGWLAVFQRLGIQEVLGVDGPWADQRKLEIPKDRFMVFDLQKPFRLDRRFDLVISLEVAQHLPGRCAEAFVTSLTELGPAIVFSAAVPLQGGIGHVNEQWPEYWAERFRRKGYVAIDCIRKRIWSNPHVEWWFAQNTLLFGERRYVERHAGLRREFAAAPGELLALVHPRRYLELAESVQRHQQIVQDIADLVRPGDSFILVDGGELENMVAGGRRALPFLERDGQYWGNPPDDRTAIRELERLRRSGARFLVFAWPAFWWLDHYTGFHRHLRAKFPCSLRNDRLVAFDLSPTARLSPKARAVAARRDPARDGLRRQRGGRRA
jgi:SAM-dependent methyltransferase